MPIYEFEKEYIEYSYKEIYSQVEGIVESHIATVIEKPSKLRLANNKIYQIQLAKNIGFKTPQSLITNDREVVLKYSKRTRWIIKPISAGAIKRKNDTVFLQTELLKENDELHDLSYCPSYFQEYIAKDYEVRLTVVGNKFYSVRIDSPNQIDWRKSTKNRYSLIAIPVDIKEMCNALMNKLDLTFGAFDFIVKNNDYYFLEVNPNGQWQWLEQILKLDISKSILSELLKEN